MKKLLLLFSALALCSCETTFPVSFHMQVTEGQSQKFSIQHLDNLYDKVPFASHKDFDNYTSFRSEDGSYGVVLQAKKIARTRIEAYTANNLGNYILPMVNGHALEIMQLKDRPITSGRMVIWGGFTEADLATLSEVIPPTPEEAKKNMQAFAKTGRRVLSAEKKAPQPQSEDLSSSTTDSKGRKIISERRGRF